MNQFNDKEGENDCVKTPYDVAYLVQNSTTCMWKDDQDFSIRLTFLK